MNYFEVRRVRLRPEYAHLYPDVVQGVWLTASKLTRLVRRQGPRAPCQLEGCDRGRVLCDLHFEFRGGTRGQQYLTGVWLPRVGTGVPSR